MKITRAEREPVASLAQQRLTYIGTYEGTDVQPTGTCLHRGRERYPLGTYRKPLLEKYLPKYRYRLPKVPHSVAGGTLP